jgi:hypothetical protein
VLVPVVLMALQGVARAAEVIVTPNASASPAEDFGGWTFKMAIASISLTVLIAALLITAYLRFAPRFYVGEDTGGAPPLRPQARAGAAPAAVVTDAPPLPKPAPPAAPAATAPADAPPAAPAAEAPPAAEPAASAPAAADAPPAAPAAPRPAPAPKQEGPLELDQETFDRVLAEELAKGTDRRVAEGRARGAAARAARRKAQG